MLGSACLPCLGGEPPRGSGSADWGLSLGSGLAAVRTVFALLLAAVALISIAAFIDACDTTGRAHDRAIISTTLALGGLALVLLWGRFPRHTWVPAVGAGIVAGGALAVLESLQFGACLS